MSVKNVIKLLKSELEFSDSSIDQLKIFHDFLLDYNKKYNLISKSTENNIWLRHILDSAQILKFLDRKKYIRFKFFIIYLALKILFDL